MAKTNPGFWPIGTLSGGTWEATVKKYNWPGTFQVNLGDVVVLDTAGDANHITDNWPSANILGAVVGKEPVTRQDASCTTLALSGATDAALTKLGLTTSGKILVATGTDVIYQTELGASGAGTGTAEKSNIGQTANVVPSGDPTPSNIGRSGHFLNAATIGTSAVGGFKIIAIPEGPDVYANTVHVILNRSLWNTGTAGQ